MFLVIFGCLICFVFASLLLVLFLYWIYFTRYIWNLPKIPIKVLVPFLRPNKTAIDLYECLENLVNSHRGTSAAWMGPRLAVFCDDPVNVKTVLNSKHCFGKPYLYRLMTAAGNGLFTSDEHIWRTDRRSINTVFSVGLLKRVEPIFNRHSINLVANLEKYANQPAIDLTDHMFRCNLDLVLNTMCQFESDSTDSEKNLVLGEIARLWEIAVNRVSDLNKHAAILYRFTQLYAEEKKIRDHLLQFAPKIEEYVRLQSQACADDDGLMPKCLVTKLIEMKGQGILDEERLYEHINTFIVAGTDTSSITMLNTLLLLAMHPDVQECLYDEITSTVTNSEYIDYDTISKLDYMDQVLKESMRLIPLTQILIRETDADAQLSDCIVPKGTIIFLSILKMFRNPEIWGSNSMEFNPDRFRSEEMDNRHPYAFIPFAAGPRNCIGSKYAMLSLKIQLCHLMLKYKFSTVMRMSDLVFKMEFLLKLANKFMIRLEKR